MPLITPPIKNIKITDAKPSANELARFAEVRRKSTISQVTEPLKEHILNGHVHTIDEMKAWLQPLGYSNAINEAAIKFILREFVMREVSTDNMMNMDLVVERLRPQLEIIKEDIEPIIIMGLYYHRDLMGSPNAFIKARI